MSCDSIIINFVESSNYHAMIIITLLIEKQTSATYTLHDDPTDPVIMTVGGVNGDQLQILGDKDGSGVPLSVDSLVLEDTEGNKTTVTLDKDNSLPGRVLSDSGASIDFEWSEDLSMVHVTAVSPGGNLQVTANVRLTSNTTNSSVERRSVNVAQSRVRRKRQLDEDSIVSVPVTVYQCDEPVNDAMVYGHGLLNYDEDTLGWSGEMDYAGKKAGVDGLYYVEIFTGAQSPIADNVQGACEHVVSILEGSCSLLPLLTASQEGSICSAIEAASLDLTRETPDDFDLVNAACDAGFRTFTFYCDSFSQTNPGDEHPAPCKSVSLTDSLINLIDSETIFLQPYAVFADGTRVDSTGEPLTIPKGLSGRLEQNFIIRDDTAEPVITNLIVSPPDPDPHEDYIVNVTYVCPTPSMNTYMDIFGTDLYMDNITCIGVTYSCSLFVPGAEELVQDLVTVTLSDDVANYSISRYVVVVF